MRLSLPEINLMEAYFTSVNVPKEIWLNKAIHVLNAPAYIKDVITLTKNMDDVDVVLTPRWDDLFKIKELMMLGKTDQVN